ncbi:penicillin-binding transpeptidase domain-containing protein [Streptomyces sp. NPDC091272]|uniref:penicillin-binding transpeptidase domain-containing protein n=1 Tax=Streptomyces sp. NPDC091272 TaxID=3365981 RepID=UPI003816F4FC
MGGERRNIPRRRNLWVAGVASLGLAGAGIGAWTVFGGQQDPRTGPPTASEVRAAADAFLDAWGRGDATAAAERTDDVTNADAALRDFQERAHLDARDLRAGVPAGARVPYSVRAEFAYRGARAPLAYESALTVVRRAGDGQAVVHWDPRVLHPRLGADKRLAVRETGPVAIRATARDGRMLDVREFPSLGQVLDGLRQTYGRTAGGSPGVELRVEPTTATSTDAAASRAAAPPPGAAASQASTPPPDAAASPAAPEAAASRAAAAPPDAVPPRDAPLLSVAAGASKPLRTTLDASVQKVAEREAALRADASIVVLKPSSGEILAVANSRTDGPNTALVGRLAPGSTMKMITGSLLLEKGLASSDKPHPCPKTASYGGWQFHNVDDFDIPGGTFRSSFAASCNTAFITQAGKVADEDLSRQARDVFGIGAPWSVGLPAFTGSVPVEHAASKAASMIGQGQVRMNPLTMASVISTARTGRFTQPYLVAPALGHRTPTAARRPLEAAAHQQLKDLLHTTATSGSAAGSMRELHGDVGAKTGSAEVIGQEKPNGWFAAWHGDIAAAAVMQRGGRGGESAGPLVAAVLKAVDSDQ